MRRISKPCRLRSFFRRALRGGPASHVHICNPRSSYLLRGCTRERLFRIPFCLATDRPGCRGDCLSPLFQGVEHVAWLQVAGVSLHPNIRNSQEALHNDFRDLRTIESSRLYLSEDVDRRPHDAVLSAASDCIPADRPSQEEQVPTRPAKTMVKDMPSRIFDKFPVAAVGSEVQRKRRRRKRT